jgi:glycine hydroxymethyltransferase
MNEKQLLDICAEYTLRTPEYNKGPIFQKGKDAFIWDVNGEKYLDLGSGQMCATLGHNHHKIVEAIQKNCEDLLHSSSSLPNEKSIELAFKIGNLVSDPLKASILLSTGSEANEVALSIAKKYTGGFEAASFHISYIGRTAVTRTLSPALTHKGYGPLIPGTFTMPGPYCYRCPVNESYPDCNIFCLETGFEMLDRWAMGQVAAVFAESIFGAGGVIESPQGFLKLLKKKCEERGILLVLDEMQTALGRCGAMFGYEQEGIVPDILTLSKTLGGGITISTATTSTEIKNVIMERGFFHSSTHAYDPFPAAVALAVIDAVIEDNLVQQSKEKGNYLTEKLKELANRHSIIGDVRGRGLLQAIELVRDRKTKEPAVEEAERFYLRCIEKGLLIRILGNPHCVLNFSPLNLIASENYSSQTTLEVQASVLANKLAEGYAGRRVCSGCEIVDQIEKLAIDRAKKLFGADHVNVQCPTATQANIAVYNALLKLNDIVLAPKLSHGGHFSHGAGRHFSAKLYKFYHYGVSRETEKLDFDEIEKLALQHSPKLIIAGMSAYPRIIDFAKLRKIADKVGAFLLVDMAHIAGLIIAGLHPNPIPFADVVTSSTHKTLGGPRGGGLILCNKDLATDVDEAVFPGTQGAPLMNIIGSRAVLFKEAMSSKFRERQKRIVENAKVLAAELLANGLRLVTGGTDNHLIIIDLRPQELNGKQAEDLLYSVNIATNKNAIPYENTGPHITGGLRLGTVALTRRGMTAREMKKIGKIISSVLQNPTNENILKKARDDVFTITRSFPNLSVS